MRALSQADGVKKSLDKCGGFRLIWQVRANCRRIRLSDRFDPALYLFHRTASEEVDDAPDGI